MSPPDSGARDWSAFDRPELLASIGQRRGDTVEALIALDGIHCANCAARAEKVVAGRVERPLVNLAAKTISFSWKPAEVPLSSLLSSFDDAGLAPRVLAQQDESARQARQQRRTIARIGVATICAMQVMMVACVDYFGGHPANRLGEMLRLTQLLFAAPCVLWAGWPFFDSAWRALRERSLNMDVPVALALTVAFGASTVRTFTGEGELYFDSATMFVWFLTLGRWLEGRTRARAGERLRLLAGRRALTAQRRRADGSGLLESVPISSLRPGDEVVVPPGESLPADGVLLDDSAELDESLLTGESRPRLHRSGDALLAGSLNAADRLLALRVTQLGGETTLAQITRLLDAAQASKPAIQRMADRVAGHFIAAVLVLSALGFALHWHQGLDSALSVALAVMVASCPCALSLAVPAALAAATSRLARRGVLTARAEALARLVDVDAVLFDKTGTLTRAELAILRTVVLDDQAASAAEAPSEADVLALAAALERGSRHPIALAFAAHDRGLLAEDVRSLPGAGIRGVVAGRALWIGAAERATLAVGAPPAVALPAGASPVWVVLTDDRRALAWFALDAPPRAEAAAVIAALRVRGLHVEISSGDAEEATAALAASLGVEHFRGRRTPAQKLERLGELRAAGRVVLAVGDGLNDAPFLAAADVSAALPQGAAVTQAQADLLLLGDNLDGLPLALDVAHQTRRRMRENLLWALVYNLTVLPLAIAGVLLPWMAAAGMSISSIVVVANALRLDRAAAGVGKATGGQARSPA